MRLVLFVFLSLALPAFAQTPPLLPQHYIHTNFDTAANIDPTKLKRAAFIGAASGYFLRQFLIARSGRNAPGS
jgi:hypothetical protein